MALSLNADKAILSGKFADTRWRLLQCAIAETLVEAIDTAGTVHDLLLARVERVALRTNVNQDVLADGRTGFNHVTAAAGGLDGLVFRVDIGFHGITSYLTGIATTSPNPLSGLPAPWHHT
tara:strand:- start:263 stop:625 length:363 start_codon:yes stop_codon:yes gene_type:complete